MGAVQKAISSESAVGSSSSDDLAATAKAALRITRGSAAIRSRTGGGGATGHVRELLRWRKKQNHLLFERWLDGFDDEEAHGQVETPPEDRPRHEGASPEPQQTSKDRRKKKKKGGREETSSQEAMRMKTGCQPCKAGGGSEETSNRRATMLKMGCYM